MKPPPTTHQTHPNASDCILCILFPKWLVFIKNISHYCTAPTTLAGTFPPPLLWTCCTVEELTCSQACKTRTRSGSLGHSKYSIPSTSYIAEDTMGIDSYGVSGYVCAPAFLNFAQRRTQDPPTLMCPLMSPWVMYPYGHITPPTNFTCSLLLHAWEHDLHVISVTTCRHNPSQSLSTSTKQFPAAIR